MLPVTARSPARRWPVVLFACIAPCVAAQDWNNPSTTLPGDAAVEQASSKARLRLGLDYPLRTSDGGATAGAGTQGAPAVSPTLQAELRINPSSYWFGSITFYRYLMSDRQQPWNPDFTYSFGYDDWHPNTFSIVYGNYTGNRLQPEQGETVSRFRQGNWSLGYKFRMPQMLDPVFKADDSHEVNCSANANVTPRYTDLRTLSIRKYKHSLSLGCRYMMPNKLYANATLFYYPDRSRQQPWDPDFTYGFGYFDWRPGTITVQYNNYAGNRYGWRDASGQGGFRRGSISISWSANW